MERVKGVEPSSPAWKAGVIAVDTDTRFESFGTLPQSPSNCQTPEPCGPCASGAARGEKAFEPEEADDGLDVRDAAVGAHVERLLQIDADNLEMLALVKGLRAPGEVLGEKHDDAFIGCNRSRC